MSSDYWALTVRLEPEATDAVANFLWEAGALGVVEEGDGTPVGLRAFFPPGSDPGELRRRVAAYLAALRALAVSPGPGDLAITRLPDQTWAEAWRAHFRPLPIGRRLLVCPPWDVPAPSDPVRAGRTPIVIEPGRAFGTGSHATTRGALELLERALAAAPAARALDVGTGSGILAVAAALLGVPAVGALDVDPDAVAAAAENAARNGVGERVRVELASLEAWAGPPSDVVLANLLGPALVALAPVLARHATGSGRLIAAGLLAPETAVVAASFVPEGFGLVEVTEHEGWAALLLRRDRAAR